MRMLIPNTSIHTHTPIHPHTHTLSFSNTRTHTHTHTALSPRGLPGPASSDAAAGVHEPKLAAAPFL